MTIDPRQRARGAASGPEATMVDRGEETGSESAQADKRYYRIGEVSRIAGVKPYVLRYWESEFRFMAPQKSRSKQRLYRRRDIDLILLVKKLLYEQRFTIAGARKKLREMGVGQALEAGSLSVETDHRTRYRRIRDELRGIRALL
jgi:DNA-binding transcriptional MerR regulator